MPVIEYCMFVLLKGAIISRNHLLSTDRLSQDFHCSGQPFLKCSSSLQCCSTALVNYFSQVFWPPYGLLPAIKFHVCKTNGQLH